MKKLAMFLMVTILPAWAQPVEAQILGGLFSKKPRANPVQRVPELIVTLKASQDERHRTLAAAELGTMDAATFAEIVPVLADALQTDPKAGVRMEAASSLGSLRPVSQTAGQALERAASGDDNLRVRWHAKSILMKYRLAGYSAASPGSLRPARTEEPPLYFQTGPVVQPAPTQSSPPPPQFPAGSKAVVKTPTSARPPVSPTVRPPSGNAPKDEITPEFRPSAAKPLPSGSPTSTTVPQQPSPAAPPAVPEVEGPALTPMQQPRPPF